MLDLPQGWVRLGGPQLRQLRRLARQGLPHPDPAMQRLAVAWARRPALSVGRVAAVAATGTLGGAALAAGAYHRTERMIVLFGLPLSLLAVALAAGPPRALIHRVNLSALLEPLVVPPRPLEVRPSSGPGVWLRQLPAYGVLVANLLAGAVARLVSVVVFCLVLLVAVIFWARSKAAPALPLRLDEAGLRLSNVDAPVPWTEIVTVELASSADAHHLGVVWRLPDRSGGSSPVRSPQDRLVLWLDPREHPPEQIVLTSRAYLTRTPPPVDEAG
jgi:hypothetical protein